MGKAKPVARESQKGVGTGANLRGGNLPKGCYRDEKGVIRKIGVDVPPKNFDKLATMKYILVNQPRKSDTAGLIGMRSWFVKNPTEFMAELERLEREKAGIVAPPPPPGGTADTATKRAAVDTEPDEGSDKSLELLERLIGECVTEAGGK